VALVLAACGDGENRPQVDIMEGSAQSGSVSASGFEGASAPVGSRYTPVSNVDVYFAIALDLRDIRAVMASASQNQPVDWAQATAIYEDGKNQTRADGSVRSLASIPNEEVQAQFPNGAATYGRPNFIDAMIRDGLNGTGRGANTSDNARRQIVDKGIQMLMYGKALQELEAARTRIEEGNLDNASGAPHAVDEAWAAIAGGPDENDSLSHGLLQTATGRESDFTLVAQLRIPLETAFMNALAAAQAGDLAAFDQAHDEVRGYLNAIFYLGTLRYAQLLQADTTETLRQGLLAEGWSFYQTIRAAVAAASPSADQTVEGAFSREATEAFPASLTNEVYAALNQPAVLQALGIVPAVTIATPPAQ
jgi:hypothetical protein